jgi:hypothetical protein
VLGTGPAGIADMVLLTVVFTSMVVSFAEAFSVFLPWLQAIINSIVIKGRNIFFIIIFYFWLISY